MGEARGVCSPGGDAAERQVIEARSPRTSTAGAIRSRSTLPSCRPTARSPHRCPASSALPRPPPLQAAGRPEPARPSLRRAEVAVSRRGAKRDAIFRRALAVADVAGALFALAFTHLVTGIQVDPVVLWLAIFAVVGASKAIGLYDRDELLIGKGTLNEIPALFQLATLLHAAHDHDRLGAGRALRLESIAVLWGALLVATMIGRGVAPQIARATTAPSAASSWAAPKQAAAIREKLGHFEPAHAEVVALPPVRALRARAPRGTDFGRYIAERNIHRVIVAQDASSDRVLQTVRYFKEYGLKVSVLPSMLEVLGSAVEFDEHPRHDAARRPVASGSSARRRLLKRGFDIAGSLGLSSSSRRCCWIIALAIKLDSRGPVFFRQTRVGRDGQPFRIVKFRRWSRGRRAEGRRCRRATRPTACSRSPTTPASPGSGGSCARRRWTSCRS